MNDFSQKIDNIWRLNSNNWRNHRPKTWRAKRCEFDWPFYSKCWLYFAVNFRCIWKCRKLCWYCWVLHNRSSNAWNWWRHRMADLKCILRHFAILLWILTHKITYFKIHFLKIKNFKDFFGKYDVILEFTISWILPEKKS